MKEKVEFNAKGYFIVAFLISLICSLGIADWQSGVIWLCVQIIFWTAVILAGFFIVAVVICSIFDIPTKEKTVIIRYTVKPEDSEYRNPAPCHKRRRRRRKKIKCKNNVKRVDDDIDYDYIYHRYEDNYYTPHKSIFERLRSERRY